MNRATAELIVRVVAVGLMLVGTMMLIAGLNAGLPLAFITIGIAITAILENTKRRQRRPAR